MTITIALLTLAALRVTRAVTLDDVGAPIRRWVAFLFARYGAWRDRIAERQHGWVGGSTNINYVTWAEHGDTLATCVWCAGFWISLAAVAVLAIFPEDVVRWACAPWALSYVVGTVEQWNR